MSARISARRHVLAGVVLVPFWLAACGGGGSGGGFGGIPGTEQDKPGGGTFILDPNRGGQASRLHLVECQWGRLVDVHGLLEDDSVDPLPVYREMLIDEAIQTDALDYRLETNAITQRTRLVILRRRGDPDAGLGTFWDLLARARQGLPPVLVRGDDSPGPFSLVPRNACLSLRFDDLLADDEESARLLERLVRVLHGYPPSVPFRGRVLFDANHGGIASDGQFHSTRVLIDATVSEEEASQSSTVVEVNSVGFPSSVLNDGRGNLSVRLPTRLDPGSGVFRVLTNLRGGALDAGTNGPIDETSPSLEIQRALRAGRSDDANSGFLLDLNRPSLIGQWPVLVTSARFDSGGLPGLDLIVDLRFDGPCQRAPRVGDVLQRGEIFLEVREAGSAPDLAGEVHEVRVRSVATPLADPAQALGGADYLTTYLAGLPVSNSCWAQVTPLPGLAPDAELAAESQFMLRFSEPMDPARVDPFENARLVRGNPSLPLDASSVVVGEARASPDLRTFALRPLLPLSFGLGGEYYLALNAGLGGPTDLAGNLVTALPPTLQFALAPGQGQPENGGVVLRFAGLDELPPIGPPDLRGQMFYDLERGLIRGRLPVAESFAADSSQPVPSIMIPFGPGVQTPLSGLGSKLQMVWRYCDVGWTVEDESKHNLDVTGLSWTPNDGTVFSDFYELFEIRLAHSRRLPDEHRTFVGTTWQCSGLGAGANTCPPCETNVLFEDNLLVDPRSPQRVVHDRSLGYRIQQRDVFVGTSGRIRMPYPLNRAGGPLQTFTWRDTAVLALGGDDGGGIPLQIEVAAPLQIKEGPAGRVAPGGNVPAWGLPLLIEIRCFPTDSALGFNPLQIYLAQNAQALPNFRAYSTGGVNSMGQTIRINPDLNPIPEGGFNPRARPPGGRTLFQSDNSFYTGELATVVRLSRAHSVWIASNVENPRYFTPVMVPRADQQPGRARMEVEFRGATGFSAEGLTRVFDARRLDPLGDADFGDVQFLQDDATWHARIEDLDGAQFFQIRFTFVNDLDAEVTAELSALGVAFEEG